MDLSKHEHDVVNGFNVYYSDILSQRVLVGIVGTPIYRSLIELLSIFEKKDIKELIPLLNYKLTAWEFCEVKGDFFLGKSFYNLDDAKRGVANLTNWLFELQQKNNILMLLLDRDNFLEQLSIMCKNHELEPLQYDVCSLLDDNTTYNDALEEELDGEYDKFWADLKDNNIDICVLSFVEFYDNLYKDLETKEPFAWLEFLNSIFGRYMSEKMRGYKHVFDERLQSLRSIDIDCDDFKLFVKIIHKRY